MLSLASFGMVSNPQAELGVPDMRPRNNEAKILMEMAQCAVWCSSNVASWDSKCQWDSGYCAACAECSAVSTPHCGYWCDMHSECNWSDQVCSGCTSCMDASNIAVSGCESWCAGNGADWNTKCEWGHGHCSGCTQCDDKK